MRLRDRAPTLGAERINCMGRSDVGGSRASVIQFQIMSCGIIELGRASARPNAEASGKKADQENAILCASAQRPYQVENVRFGSKVRFGWLGAGMRHSMGSGRLEPD